MSYAIVFKERSKSDVAEEARKYNEKKEGLGYEFLEEMGYIVEQLRINPYTYQVRHKNMRLGLLKRFPYVIVYEIIEKQVAIYKVLHARKHPKKRYNRIKKK